MRRALKDGGIVPFDADAKTAGEEDEKLTAAITRHFAEALRRAPEEIAPDAHFFYDLGGTSLDYFAMISAVQGEFSVGFPTTAGQNLATVREICRFIREQG